MKPFTFVIVLALLILQRVTSADAPAGERPSFMTGVDTNYFLDLQNGGAKWSVDGVEVDPLAALARAGANTVRIRLWTGEDGVNGLAYATETALRAQRAGLRPYVVIFLSENWADMVKQPVPAIWKDLDEPAKCAAIEAYAERVTRHMIDKGVNVDLFEIGNEIDYGLCGVFEEEWPKRVSIEYLRANIWSKMVPMIKAAQAGVRRAKPEAKFMLHLAQWSNAGHCIAFFNYMTDNGVTLDQAGLSYFPTSAGKAEERTLSFFSAQIEKIANEVKRTIVICETAFPSMAEFPGQFADWNKPVDGFTLDPSGQAKWLGDFLSLARNHEHIAGVFYWSPEWNVRGGMWEAFALFDADGRARPALQSLPNTPTTMQPASTAPTTALAANATFIDAAGENVYLGNLHAHTALSDGTGTPAEAFAYARDVAGLDFLAVTEHNHLIGGDDATAETRAKLYNEPGDKSLLGVAETATVDGRFVALTGQEFSSMSKGNHVNVFDVRGVIDVPNGQFDKLLEWTAKQPDRTGNSPVLQFNHPALGRPGKTIDKNEFGRDDFVDDETWIKKMGAVTSLIELLNGEPPETSTDRRSPQVMEHHYKLYLRLGFKLAPTGNQDNHRKHWGNATDTRTGIVAPWLSRASLLNAMRARHVYASEDRNLKVVARIDARLCGDVASLGQTRRDVTIDCSFIDPDETDADYTIEAFSGVTGARELPTVVATYTWRGDTPLGRAVQLGSVTVERPGQFIYLRITQSATTLKPSAPVDRLWTAPVWFEN